MFSEQFAPALPEAAAARLRSLVVRTQTFLLGALEEGQREGALRYDLAAEALLSVVFGMLMQLVNAQTTGQGRAQDADEICATLLALLQPPPAP